MGQAREQVNPMERRRVNERSHFVLDFAGIPPAVPSAAQIPFEEIVCV